MRSSMALPLLALLPAASALSMSTLARPRMALSRITMCDAAPQDKVVDKQMSNDKLIRFSSLNDEWQPLVTAALIRLDRNRVLQDKPKYGTIEGMIDAYVEEAGSAGLGWTRDDAESGGLLVPDEPSAHDECNF